MACYFGHYSLAFVGQLDGFAVAVAVAGPTSLAETMCAECPGHCT